MLIKMKISGTILSVGLAMFAGCGKDDDKRDQGPEKNPDKSKKNEQDQSQNPEEGSSDDQDSCEGSWNAIVARAKAIKIVSYRSTNSNNEGDFEMRIETLEVSDSFIRQKFTYLNGDVETSDDKDVWISSCKTGEENLKDFSSGHDDIENDKKYQTKSERINVKAGSFQVTTYFNELTSLSMTKFKGQEVMVYYKDEESGQIMELTELK